MWRRKKKTLTSIFKTKTNRRKSWGKYITMKEQHDQFLDEVDTYLTGLGRWSWLHIKINKNIKKMVILDSSLLI